MPNQLVNFLEECCYSAYAEQMPGMISIRDINLKYVWANNNFLENAGVDAIYQLKKLDDDKLPWYKLQDLVLKQNLKVLETKASYEFLTKCEVKNHDSCKTFLIHKNPILSSTKEILGVFIHSIDISEFFQISNKDDNLILKSKNISSFSRPLEHKLKFLHGSKSGCFSLQMA